MIRPRYAGRLSLIAIVVAGLAVLSVTTCLRAQPWADVTFEPTFGPHPRLATTAERFAADKAGPDAQTKREQAVRRAAPFLDNPVNVPTEWGNWIFYYANPKTGGRLEAVSLTEHRDPATGEVFTDRRIVEAYRTILHNRADAAAEALGWAYAWTGDDRYAAEVMRILTIYADVYDTFPRRRDRWDNTGLFAPLGARRYCQSLDEAVGIIHLAHAYDLTRNSPVWTDERAWHVEDRFFRLTADTLQWSTWGHNHQTWYNAGLTAIAVVLADDALLNRVLTMRRGFLHQMEHNVTEGGIWHEGAMAYHLYALQALIKTVDAARHVGVPLHENESFKAMFLGPMNYAWPGGQFPAINDSDPSHLRSFRPFFRWAWETWGDERFAQAWAAGNADHLAELLGEGATVQPPPTHTADFPGVGLLILRRGEGDSEVCVMLDYGKHGAAHGHPDKLNLMLWSQGREWLLDPGRLSYSHPEYHTWYTQTVAHNTVTLAGRTQSPDDGELRWLDVTDAYAAVQAESRGAYRGAALRRSLFLNDHLLIDVFDVLAPRSTQIDWHAHAVVRSVGPVPPPNVRLVGEPVDSLGDRDGYQHLTDVKRWPVNPPDWAYHDDHRTLRVWLAGDDAEQRFSAVGMGYSAGQRAPRIVRRIPGDRARFVAVWDLTGEAAISDVQLHDPAPDSDARVTVRWTGGTLDVTFTDERVIVQEP